MVVIDATVRLIPGVLGAETSIEDESHVNGLLEHPQYTRPPLFQDWKVPKILLSGNHAAIARWRREQSLKRTLRRRPDLIEKIVLSSQDKMLIDKFNQDENK